MKGIREIALTPYYPYGKNKEKIIAARTEQIDKAISEHDLEIRADERRKFAEGLHDCGYLGKEDCDAHYGLTFYEPLPVKEVLEEYEKEQKNER